MNPTEPKPPSEASVSELMTQLASQTSRLLRDEMRLAQREFVESAKHAGMGAGLISVAGILVALAAGAGLVSKKQLDQASPNPEMTIANVKQDIDEVRDARHGH